jgi:hypothetical protein
MLAGKLRRDVITRVGAIVSKADLHCRTNTDGVIIDPSKSHEVNRGIIAWYALSACVLDTMHDRKFSSFESTCGLLAPIDIRLLKTTTCFRKTLGFIQSQFTDV